MPIPLNCPLPIATHIQYNIPIPQDSIYMIATPSPQGKVSDF